MTRSGRPSGEENNVNQPNEGSEIPPQQKEPEGGPFARAQAFLDERLTPLRPASNEGDRETESPPLPSSPEEEANQPRDRSPLPPNFRRDHIDQYRQRQRQKIERLRLSAPDAVEGPVERDENNGESVDPETYRLMPPIRFSNSWVPIGPSVLRQGQAATRPATSGRVVGIAVVPSGDRLYVASANGGVWRSEDTGQTWRSRMDAFDLNPTQPASDSLACGAIAVVPGATANQDRLYVGTGEGAGGKYYGVGPILSIDGGNSWITETSTPDLAGSAFYALAIDPADSDRVLGATRNRLYRREPDGSGGFHWMQKSMPGAGSSWITSVVTARSAGTTTFYAASRYGPVFSSTDGDTWNTVGTGFPTADVGRIGLAVQPDNPDTVYALIANSSDSSMLGVWRLDASDNNWRPISGYPANLFGTTRYQGDYDLAIAVDPNNVNRLYLGGSTVLAGGYLVADNIVEGEWSGALYRCTVSSNGSGAGLTYKMTHTYIGSSVHADIHTLVFTPGDSNKLWVGCDGGVFYSTNPTGSGNIFQAKNTGLAALTMNHLGQHPTEDAVLFCGSQDNGAGRYTGEEVWLHSAAGDGGYCEINWHNPYLVLSTYVRGGIRRSTDGGDRYSYTSVNVPLDAGESVLFYSPMTGTPRNLGSPSEADIVAFGSIRPWISTTFGGGWQSIPNGNLAADSLNDRIRSLAFASATKLYAGTMVGGVYRFDQAGGTWTRTQIDTVGATRPLAGPVTDIAVDPADATGNSIYITFGGTGDYRRVWHFDGTQWQPRSGPAAGSLTSLLDVQANAIVVDPAHHNHIYIGADIGIWRSTDGGANWSTFSEGLPDAAVLDMKLHEGRRLLRASTHGRGVFERTIDKTEPTFIELYVKDTVLDQGRFPTEDGQKDPTLPGNVVDYQFSPDIRIDTPDKSKDLGFDAPYELQYQYPDGEIDFLQFCEIPYWGKTVVNDLISTATSRVYVQIHNRGIFPADNVRVMLLLADESVTKLPDNYWLNVQQGKLITTVNWQTVGIVNLQDIRAGFPKVATFYLSSDMLPKTNGFTGTSHHHLVALVHHELDPYTSTEINLRANTLKERKAAQNTFSTTTYLAGRPGYVIGEIGKQFLEPLTWAFVIVVGSLLITPEGPTGPGDPFEIGPLADVVSTIVGGGLIVSGIGGLVSNIFRRRTREQVVI
jgi:hypothetical protein